MKFILSTYLKFDFAMIILFMTIAFIMLYICLSAFSHYELDLIKVAFQTFSIKVNFLSFLERIGFLMGQFIPTLESFQIIPDSLSFE